MTIDECIECGMCEDCDQDIAFCINQGYCEYDGPNAIKEVNNVQ